MSKLISIFKTLRRNWKKSIFFFGLTSYGISLGVERYKIHQMMRLYCQEAKKYGDKALPIEVKPKHITVILNPAANNNKALTQFEKFSAPLLHLAGFKISVFKTEHENQAQELMEIMSNTDAVIVAGGNGTLHQAVTGLMQRPQIQAESPLPIGIVPLGKTNTVAKHLFGLKSSSNAQLIAESTMAVIRENTIEMDVMKIQDKEEEKPIYAMSTFELGIFANLEPKIQKYWYLGSLKAVFANLIASFKKMELLKFDSFEYKLPCSGCSKCFQERYKKIKPQKQEQTRWWSIFMPRQRQTKDVIPKVDYSKIINDECGKSIKLEPTLYNLLINTPAFYKTKKEQGGPLSIKIHSTNMSIPQFISSGLNYHKRVILDQNANSQIIEAQEINLIAKTNIERNCYIDDEKYKLSTYKISLLPKQILIYG